MPRRRQLPSAASGYVFAIGITVLAFTTRYVFRSALGDFSPFLPMCMAVVMTAWYGGFWPGTMATVVGAGLAIQFFPAPGGMSLLATPSGGASLLVFIALGFTTSFLCEELHAAQRLLEAEQNKARDTHVFNAMVAELSSDFSYKARVAPDGHLVVEALSDGFTRLLGYSLEELNGMGVLAILPPEDRAATEAVMARLRTGEIADGEARCISKNRQVYWLRYRMRPMLDDKGALTHIYGAASDNTQQKLADLAVRRSEEELRRADRRKDEFLATLAHELRNPLAPLRTAIEIMERADNEPLREEALHISKRQVHQMVRLIDDLLDVGRITSGRLALRREQVELAAVLYGAVETSRPLIEASAHVLDVTLPSDPVFLNGDPTRLAQVFGNLLNNAAKFTPRGGHIALVAERKVSDQVQITVRDTGVGIPAEMIPQIFEMFTQVEPSSRTGVGNTAAGGLGIGLTIAKLLVEMHGGRIEARSEGPVFGSEFIVWLPVLPGVPARVSEIDVTHRVFDNAAQHRVLVVDDNPDAVASLEMYLRLSSHYVCTAGDGIEALHVASTERPDVVLLDIGLPRMSGYDVARRIREFDWGKSVLLVAMTGWGQPGDRRRSKEAGFDFHLTKPVDPGVLDQLLTDPDEVRVGEPSGEWRGYGTANG
jgi:PAS domain S-box-containing protein